MHYSGSILLPPIPKPKSKPTVLLVRLEVTFCFRFSASNAYLSLCLFIFSFFIFFIGVWYVLCGFLFFCKHFKLCYFYFELKLEVFLFSFITCFETLLQSLRPHWLCCRLFVFVTPNSALFVIIFYCFICFSFSH